MIEELHLVNIERVIRKGGSTTPLLINAENDDGEINPYVVKLYKKDYVRDNFTVAKEILISELSQEFNLPLPNYGVINLNHELLYEYYDEEFISKLDEGYKFCNQYLEGSVIYNPLLNDGFINNYDIENVFAFDNFIINMDRGGLRNKPNLLIRNNEFLLIDHEQCLPFLDKHLSEHDFNPKLRFKTYKYNRHIFYENLKRVRDKKFLFNEFMENLRVLNLNFLNTLYIDYAKYNIVCAEKSVIFAYFNWFKSNPDYLLNKLKDRTL